LNPEIVSFLVKHKEKLSKKEILFFQDNLEKMQASEKL
jgi:menaquinone-dependent protoporphyrinogen IX oxidase